MFNTIGYSVYLSNYHMIKEQLSSLSGEGCLVFTSFHISEEFSEDYPVRAARMCNELREMGYQIIGDVSRKTLAVFSAGSITECARLLGLSVVRIDYGFTEKEIINIGRHLPVCLNASTLKKEEAARIAGQVKEIYAMHNFYPRPETGLDEELFTRINKGLRENGVKVMAFIPGDIHRRKPLFEGLPTLERHRKAAPYAAYVDMRKSFCVDSIFVGDGIISKGQAALIHSYDKDGILRLPVELSARSRNLYGRIFTIREDSPSWLKRFQESREYSCLGESIEPERCMERVRGCLTVDNERYLRYSGEVQLIIKNQPADEKVNVIGHVQAGYEGLLDNIKNGDRVMLLHVQEL